MPAEVRHILVADDDAPLLRTVQLTLSEAGFRVGTARDGQEAMAYIREHGPDAAVLDVYMPEMDGFETLRAIRQEFPHIRVLMVSGGSCREGFDVLRLTSKLGAHGVLQKPFTDRQLIAFVTGVG